MKKLIFMSIVFALTIALCYGTTFALQSEDGTKLSGKHYQFNIIGHPNNNFSGDYSNGRTIMVPLKTDNGPTELVCDVDCVKIVDDEEPTYVTSVVGGARIYFKVCDACTNFQI